MREITFINLFLLCVVSVTVEAVVHPRRRQMERYFSGHNRFMQRARIILSSNSDKPKWKPTVKKCCKVGQRTARRKLSCDMVDHIIMPINTSRYRKTSEKDHNKLEAMLKKGLPMKIERCSVKFGRFFSKCCSIRELYYKELLLCKKKQKWKRKPCRQATKDKYYK